MIWLQVVMIQKTFKGT